MSFHDHPARITALDAISEAQKLAFSPIAFQASVALVRLRILDAVEHAGDRGASVDEIAADVGLGTYGVSVLLAMGASIGLVWRRGERYVLDKIGHFLLNDKMTRVNMNFVADVCYSAMSRLKESVEREAPCGLREFGDWRTLYPGLTQLPEPARTSWFAFDQFYSNAAFADALPLVFARGPRHILDIGGNTGEWALACAAYDPTVRITLVDLPEQIAAAAERLRSSPYRDRIELCAVDILDELQPLPRGADVIWTSQFLDCFSEDQIEKILDRIARVLPEHGTLFVLELFSDRQRHAAAAYSLNATSLYFTCIANGTSRMYASGDIVRLLDAADFEIGSQCDDLGLGHTLLHCSKRR
jgi:ubiquinone/menaquinone biosynthesis C-methylase UbiE